MPSSPDQADTGAPPPAKDNLETALAAAADGSKAGYDGRDISADDAGASKLALEMEQKRRLPTDTPPGLGDD